MSFSHTLAVVVLFLALVTWFFDKELKRKEARCVSICETYRGSATGDSAFVGSNDTSDDRYDTNSDPAPVSSPDYTPPSAGRGRWGGHRIGKCECDPGGE